MFNTYSFIVVFIFGIIFGAIYNILIIKDYPDYKRKFAYFITILIFLSLSLMIYFIISTKSYVNSKINNYSVMIEQYLMDYYPDNEFIKNGFDLKSVNNDIVQINSTVSELKAILPSHKELGINKLLYDLFVDYAINKIQKQLMIINYSTKVVNIFSNIDNVLTVSSIINGLKVNAIKLVNTISLIIVSIIIITVFIYIVPSLIVVKREKNLKICKSNNNI